MRGVGFPIAATPYNDLKTAVGTLEEVIRYYNEGGIKNPYLAQELKHLHLTPQERADLLAFLYSLTGAGVNVPTPAAPN